MKNLKIKIALVSGLIASSAVLAGATYSAAPEEIMTAHYSGPDFRQQVGWSLKECDNTFTKGGLQTGYRKQVYRSPCW